MTSKIKAIEAYEAALWRDMETLWNAVRESETLDVLLLFEENGEYKVNRLTLYVEDGKEWMLEVVGTSVKWRYPPTPPKVEK